MSIAAASDLDASTYASSVLLLVTDHYILFLVYPWDHLVVVLDPAHYAEKTFTEFLVLLNLAHKYYKDQSGRVKDASKSKLLVKTQWPCCKQLPGSILCGYYMCEMLQINGRYTTEFADMSLENIQTGSTKKTILNLCADICRYIRHDVCNHLGEFYDPESDLAKNDPFKRLREWEKEFM
uniref:Ubiquitin-like protease family profile domain-containing protein n=1 Tax=Oryza barthii TaxID=65489 RepID=A0A0D3HB46_9ORYZ